MLRASSISHSLETPLDTVTLVYDDRHRRRIAMTADGGTEFLLDLAHATELRDGDALMLESGEHIQVIAAPEALMRATCDDALHLVRTAWHVGNRHVPAEITIDGITLRWDHVIAEMLEKLGCKVEKINAPFNPEGGAYGHGRTHGHSHG